MLDRFTGTTSCISPSSTAATPRRSIPRSSAWTEFLSFYVAEEIPHRSVAAQLAINVVGQEVFGVPSLALEPDRFADAPSFAAALLRYEAEPKVRILFDNGAGARPGYPIPAFERSYDRWPIATVEPAVWYFAADGKLDPTQPSGEGADAFLYDPSVSQNVTDRHHKPPRTARTPNV